MTRVERVLAIIIASCVLLLIGANVGRYEDRQRAVAPIYTEVELIDEPVDTWSVFIEALIHVESRGQSGVLGAHDDCGVLQITPIMLREANRVSGYERFTSEDRFNRETSIEIFNVVQSVHNPERDMHYALKIWNPRAPLSYHENVMNKFNELLNYE